MKDFVEIPFQIIDSTNTWAHQNLDQLEPNKVTCVIAEEQTKGRGRELREWVSPPGNVYCTFCFQLAKDTRNVPSVAQVIGYSAALVLQKYKLYPQIKWPNDVLIDGKKIAGILCETIFNKDHVQVLLGIGLNVNLEQTVIDEIDQPATSMSLELGKSFSVEEIYVELREQFLKDLETFKKNNFSPFQTPIQSMLAYKGQEIELTRGKEIISGICHSVSCAGELNIELDSGEMKTISSGEILFLE